MINKEQITNKSIIYVIFYITILAVFIYLGNKKYLEFCDEYYSYESANAVTETKDCPFDDINEWHSSSEVHSFYGATSLNPHLYKLQNDLYRDHVPFYFYILRILSIINLGHWSKWTALIINAVFLAGVIAILTHRFYKYRWGILPLAMIVLHPVTLMNMSMTLRMYIMMAFFVLAFFDVIRYDRMMTRKELVIFILVTLGGLLTHYYFWIYAGIFSAVYVAGLLIKKNFKVFWQFIIAWAVTGFIATVIYPQWVRNIFMSPTQKGWTSITGIFKLSSFLGKIESTLTACKIIIFYYVPWFVIALIFLAFIPGIASYIKANVKKPFAQYLNNKTFYILLSTILYIAFVGYTQPDESAVDRYFWVPCLVLLVLMGELIAKMLDNRLPLIANTAVLVITIILVVISFANVFLLVNQGYLASGKNKTYNMLKQYKDIPWVIVCGSPTGYSDKYMLTIPDRFIFVATEEEATAIGDKEGKIVLLREGRFGVMEYSGVVNSDDASAYDDNSVF